MAVLMGLFDFITDKFSKKKKSQTSKKGQVAKGSAKSSKGTKPPGKGKNAPASNIDLKVKKTKARKKAVSVSSAPIKEEALGFSISLKNSHSRQRQAVRIVLTGLEVYIHRLKKRYPVTNISATGLGFKFEKPRVKGGVRLDMDLIHEDKVVTKKVQCKVMRHEQGSVGCIFVELDRPQDDAVHKLVLLGQKQQAERKKKGTKAEPKPTKL